MSSVVSRRPGAGARTCQAEELDKHVATVEEAAGKGVCDDTAVVVDAGGSVLGTDRKTDIPQVGPIFWEKGFFKPGNLGHPVFATRVGRVGVFI